MKKPKSIWAVFSVNDRMRCAFPTRAQAEWERHPSEYVLRYDRPKKKVKR